MKRSFFLLPKCSGKPKYFPKPHSLLIPRVNFAASLTAGGVFEEKVIDDFARLILCPEANSYLLRIDTSVAQLEALDLLKNIVSSANRR